MKIEEYIIIAKELSKTKMEVELAVAIINNYAIDKRVEHKASESSESSTGGSNPPTSKQIDLLKKMNKWKDGLSKQEAIVLIGESFKQRDKRAHDGDKDY
jgi:hypothetical protein